MSKPSAKPEKKPTARQRDILGAIVTHHTATAQPVSSQLIITKYLRGLSSATVRNEMVVLEDLGLLEKTHSSSGRVPSIKGYQMHAETADKTSVEGSIMQRLRNVLSQRSASIDDVFAQSMAIISEVTTLTSVITQDNADELLKRIDFVPISEHAATVIVVTSAGTVNNTLINIENTVGIKDIAVCVRIFNDRLIDTRMGDIKEKARALEPLLRKQIKDYEFVLQEIVERIFASKAAPSTKLIDIKNLTVQPEFKDVRRLEKVIALLEDASVWKQIASDQQKTGGATRIAFGKDLGLPESVAVASTTVHAGERDTSLAIVGPTRMDYGTVKALLEFIKSEVERLWRS